MQALNASTQEVGESLYIQGQPGLQSEFQDTQDCYTEKPCLGKRRVPIAFVIVGVCVVNEHVCAQIAAHSEEVGSFLPLCGT